jgi:hypothetical protein
MADQHSDRSQRIQAAQLPDTAGDRLPELDRRAADHTQLAHCPTTFSQTFIGSNHVDRTATTYLVGRGEVRLW